MNCISSSFQVSSWQTCAGLCGISPWFSIFTYLYFNFSKTKNISICTYLFISKCLILFLFTILFFVLFQFFKLIFYTAVSNTEILSQNLKNFPLQSVQSHLFVTLVRVASLSEPFDFSALSVFCTQNFVFLLLSMPYHTWIIPIY